MLGSQPRVKSRIRRYELDQCALYKLESKKRLATLLGFPLATIRALCGATAAYRQFEQAESVCEFTGKVTKARWVQEPLGDLKRIQSRITKLLGRVALPDYCHGATSGRSYRSNAAAHVDSACAATFDIKAFFPSTRMAAVYSFFREGLLCSHDVSEILVGITCRDGSLPTGSPSSPILSFYANRGMFEELNQVAITRQLAFTVYIDDLTFSGASIPPGFDRYVRAIVQRHGLRLSVQKTKFFAADTPKHITGTVILDGKVKAPHTRFRKARAIAAARRVATDPVRRLQLSRKLAGLLGEAAYLDGGFVALASQSYRMLANDAAVVAQVAAPQEK